MAIKFQFNDGGRASSGYKGQAGDCVCRAVAITTGKAYQEVYDALNGLGRDERAPKRGGRSSARTGVHKRTYRRYLESLGFRWTPTMFIGSGCKVHLREGELPMGRLIVVLSGHVAAVIDSVLHDTDECSRDGTRCVYGYFHRPDEQEAESVT